ncbi:MAG: serine hydrolase domain-containing protein [Gemmatimonadota bacterium]
MYAANRTHSIRGSAVLCAMLVALPAAVRGQESGQSQSIDDVVAAALSRQMTPGAVVAVVRRDSMVFLQAYGRTSLETDAPSLTVDAVFRAAAATELVTALSATALAASDRLSLDAPLGTRVAGLPDELHGVTVEQLLTHTAGMAHQLAAPGRGGADDLGAAARQLTRYDRMSEPGALYSQSVPGIMLAALAMQTFAGAPYSDLVRSAVFEPLGMNSSAVTRSLPPGLTRGWTASRSAAAPVVPVQPVPDSAVALPVRGLHTTASDLARLGAALLSGGAVGGHRVLPPGAVRDLLRLRSTVPGSGAGAAAGVRIGTWAERPSILVQGGHAGHSVLLHLLPNDGLGVIILANNESAGLGGVADFVFARLLGLPDARSRRVQPPAPDPAVTARLLEAAGRYENGSEVLEIVNVEGRPMLKSGDLQLELEPAPAGAAAALMDGRVALMIRLIDDASGGTYLWVGDRALARRE